MYKTLFYKKCHIYIWNRDECVFNIIYNNLSVQHILKF